MNSPVSRLVVLLAIAAIAAGLTGWLHPRAPVMGSASVAEITVDEARKLAPSSVLWVDARSREAFERRHIPGAVTLNEEQWDRALEGLVVAWQPGQWVIVYCDSAQCRASESVARRIVRELKIEPVRTLKGGWQAWQDAEPGK